MLRKYSKTPKFIWKQLIKCTLSVSVLECPGVTRCMCMQCYITKMFHPNTYTQITLYTAKGPLFDLEEIPWPRPRLLSCRWRSHPPPSPAHRFPQLQVWWALLHADQLEWLCSPPVCPTDKENTKNIHHLKKTTKNFLEHPVYHVIIVCSAIDNPQYESRFKVNVALSSCITYCQ